MWLLQAGEDWERKQGIRMGICIYVNKRSPALLVSGRACIQSTATHKPVTAQPTGHEDKVIHSSPQGATNGKQGTLPDKNQKRKQGGRLIENHDEVSDKCSHLGQSHKAAKPDGASTTSRRPRTGHKYVIRFRDKFRAYVKVDERQVSLGSYFTEDEAARAVDECHIYQNLEPINFPGFPYNKERIRQPADFSTFIEQMRKQATQATKAGQSTRFTGVSWSALHNRWAVYLTVPTEQTGRREFLGCFDTDEEAATVADKYRIRHGLKAVNFPDSQYDHHQISQVAHFGEQSRAEAIRTVKARQHSRFTGVTWKKATQKWEAYVNEPYMKPNQKKGFKRRILGCFANEEDAARAADTGRIQNGQKAVNSKLLSSSSS
ncbi:hypothetical protein WJX79_001587 [Trebouxia sp. C0005]